MTRVFRPKKIADNLKSIAFIVALVVIVILVYFGINSLGSTQDQKQAEIAHDAIIKAAVQCYALESQYPESLQYLVDNYGLALDESKYIYHYRAIGSNLVPEIQVFPRTQAGG